MEKEDPEKRVIQRIEAEPMQGVTFTIHGKTEVHVGIIVDTSERGIGITSPIEIAPGELVHLMIGETEARYTGEVRRCEPDPWIEDTYLIGVKIRLKEVADS